MNPDSAPDSPTVTSPSPSSVPPTSGPCLASPSPATVLLNQLQVLRAVADPVRHGVLRELAKGTPVSVNDLADLQGRWPDSMSKHLKILREARLIVTVPSPDGDSRKQFSEIPAPFRTRDAAGRTLLDFGCVVLRF